MPTRVAICERDFCPWRKLPAESPGTIPNSGRASHPSPTVESVTNEESIKPKMSTYEQGRWAELNAHWAKPPRQLLPTKTRAALTVAGQSTQRGASAVGAKVSGVAPSKVKEVSGAVVDATLAPTVKAVTKLLEFTTEVVSEFSKPDKVLAHHRNNGHDIRSVSDLQRLDLQELDAYTRRMSLKWRAVGAVQGGALGALAFVPGPGTFASISLDVVVSHALTSAIATRVAYAYGFDAMDPDQQRLIERMVRRTYKDMAPKAGTLHQSSKAFRAGQGRVRWSAKLRKDEKLLAAVEKLMKQFTNAPVPVGKVVGKMPVLAVITTAGLNQHMLADVAAQARLYAATVLLAQKYDMPLPPQFLVDDADTPHARDADS